MAIKMHLNPLLETISDNAMGFLNEIQLDYPEAISLASGRPDGRFFHLESCLDHFYDYVDHKALTTHTDRKKTLDALGQYNRTKGIVNEIAAKFLEQDEGIAVSPESILITVGTQEAMIIAVNTICDRDKDTVIIENPAYPGMMDLLKIGEYHTASVPLEEEGIDLVALEKTIIALKNKGRNPKLLYTIPDYQNPTGTQMSLAKRKQLLELAEKYNFLIFEDNAYREFIYEGEQLPTLKSMDQTNRVIYALSFSKLLFPGLRLAIMAADQKIPKNDSLVNLSDEMAGVKAYITVNTPTINQAILGGVLLKNGYSLKDKNREKTLALKRKRDGLLRALDKYLDKKEHPWAGNISWNRPKGGFFLSLKIPFEAGKKEVIECAQNFGVIFCPMAFFHLKKGGEKEIRLAFSNLKSEEIDTAAKQLAHYLKSKI